MSRSRQSLDRGSGSADAGHEPRLLTALEEGGEIDAALADRLRAWAGFRNVLVHEYLVIDHGIAYRAIRDELGDLEAFARWAAEKL